MQKLLFIALAIISFGCSKGKIDAIHFGPGPEEENAMEFLMKEG